MNVTQILLIWILLQASWAFPHDHHRAQRRAKTQDPISFYVNIHDRMDDSFKVEIRELNLARHHNTFQFAATAPGTYQTMDMGRFVRAFKAFDSKGNPSPVHRSGQNSFRLERPTEVVSIQYAIAETWDTRVQVNEIYPMAGTSLEKDHALINGQAVFGYFRGMQGRPMRIHLDYPSNWDVGTALRQEAEGLWLANNYDHVVDSPILMGELTFANRQVGDCDVRLFAYSKSGIVQAEELMVRLDDIIEATDAFLDGFPVDQYTFLYHFEDVTFGAWEHSYSSFYVIGEQNLDDVMENFIPRSAAHEIFHMVTPLHIHSERVQPFNFQHPNPSAHVWFYEGVTEWACHMMRLRAGQIDLEAYMKTLTNKLVTNDRMDTEFSLERIGLESYSRKGQWEWANIYARGAVTAALLDLLILDRTNGKRGLREVIQDLALRFGPEKAFPENAFYDIFVAHTHPDVGPFLKRYVQDSQPLPIKDYLELVGIDYIAQKPTFETVPDVGLHLKITMGMEVVLEQVSPRLEKAGLRKGDRIIRFSGFPVTGKTLNQIKAEMKVMSIGQPFTVEVRRQNESLRIPLVVGEKEGFQPHVFEIQRELTPRQARLRSAWMRNLKHTPARF